MSYPRIVWSGCIVALVGVIALFCFNVATCFVNVPYVDDYDSILSFLIAFRRASWTDQLALIIKQHNEHRLVVLHLIVVGIYSLFGLVDFRLLNLIGLLFYLGIAALYAALLRHKDIYSWLTFLCICLFLFQPQSYQSFIWATASLSNFTVMFFALASLCCLAGDGRGRLFSALLLSYLALLSQANGLAVIVAGAMMLLWLKAWRRLGWWLFGNGLGLLLFFFRYRAHEGHPPLSESLYSPVRTFEYLLTFIGAPFGFDSQVASAVCGLVLIGISVSPAVARRLRFVPASGAMLLFCFITALMNALSRAPFGVEYILSPFNNRYRLYGVLFAISLVVVLLETFRSTRAFRYIFAAVFCSSVCFQVASTFRYLPQLQALSTELSLGMERYSRSKAAINGLLYPVKSKAAATLHESLEQEIFRYEREPRFADVSLAPVPCPARQGGSEVKGDINSFERLGSVAFVHGWAFRRIRRLKIDEVLSAYLLVKSDVGCFEAALTPIPRFDVVFAYGNPNLLNSGFASFVALPQSIGTIQSLGLKLRDSDSEALLFNSSIISRSKLLIK